MNEPDPDASELDALHDALVTGRNPTVPARLADLLLPPLRRRFSGTKLADPHSVDSLIGLSIARYLADPSRWRRDRAPLLAFLWQDISGDIKNERGSHARLRRHEEPDSPALEFGAADRNLSVEEEVLDKMDPFDTEPSQVERARALVGGFDERDTQLVELLGAGVRATSPYAEVLGIAHLPDADQATEVKRHKDRLKKRLGVIRDQLDRPH